MEIVVSVALAVVGWLVSQWLARRSLRRDTTIDFLLSAYRRLEGASNRYPLSVENQRGMESAMADIQLLGSPRQVELSTKAMGEFAEAQEVSLDDLLNDLRISLRKELLLQKVDGNPRFLRFAPHDRDSLTDR